MDDVITESKTEKVETPAVATSKQLQSFDAMAQEVRDEFWEEYGQSGIVGSVYPSEIYPDFVIAGDGDDYYKIPYTRTATGDIEFADFSQWVKVERDWVIPSGEAKEHKDNLISRVVKSVMSAFKAGARHSKSDTEMLQNIHDHATALGAQCTGSMSVLKQADGKLRWVMFSSTAYQDRDGEIVSQKALADDVARADATGEYGPLDWWHVPGLELGRCDFNALDGKVLIESGTFASEAIGEAVKASADTLGGSIAFYHPATEPNADGVYHNIRRFARAILPQSKASNLFTQLKVKESNMNIAKEKFEALKGLLGDSLAQELVAKSEQVQKAADEAGVKFKETNEKATDTPKTIAAMTEADLKEFIQKCMSDMSAGKKEVEAQTDQTAQATKALSDELTKLKNLQSVSAKRVTELEAQLAELTGTQPRINTKPGYRATEDSANVREKAQTTPPATGPQADPGFLAFLTGAHPNGGLGAI